MLFQPQTSCLLIKNKQYATPLHWHQNSRDRMESNYFCLKAHVCTIEYSSMADEKKNQSLWAKEANLIDLVRLS